MAQIHFISETYIANYSPSTLNNQSKDISPHVTRAQDLFLRNILGDSFMELLKVKYNLQTLSSEEVILVKDYIKPAVLWRTITLASPFLQYQLRNKGYQKNTDDAGESTELAELKFIINEAKNSAEVYETLLHKYLCKNSKLFPGYQNQDGLTPPDKSGSAFDSGLIFY